MTPATGTTSRPGEASWSSSACGSCRASAETSTRSYGAPSGTPSTPGSASPIRAHGCPVRARFAAPKADQLGLQLDADDGTPRPGQVRQQRGGPPRPRPHVEHPVAGAHLQQPQHRGDRPRLAAGLAVAEVERPVVRRPPDLVGWQEAHAGLGPERGAHGVHAVQSTANGARRSTTMPP